MPAGLEACAQTASAPTASHAFASPTVVAVPTTKVPRDFSAETCSRVRMPKVKDAAGGAASTRAANCGSKGSAHWFGMFCAGRP